MTCPQAIDNVLLTDEALGSAETDDIQLRQNYEDIMKV